MINLFSKKRIVSLKAVAEADFLFDEALSHDNDSTFQRLVETMNNEKSSCDHKRPHFNHTILYTLTFKLIYVSMAD